MTPERAEQLLPTRRLQNAAVDLLLDLVKEQTGYRRNPAAPNKSLVVLIGQQQAEILAKYSLGYLSDLTIAGLVSLGITRESAQKIRAAFTFAHEAAQQTPLGNIVVTSPDELEPLMRPKLALAQEEEMWVAYLDGNFSLLEVIQAGKLGGRNYVSSDFPYLLRRGLELRADSVVLMHNHPDGLPVPSEADILFTAKALEVFREHKINVVDHLILGRPGYVSFFNNGFFDVIEMLMRGIRPPPIDLSKVKISGLPPGMKIHPIMGVIKTKVSRGWDSGPGKPRP